MSRLAQQDLPGLRGLLQARRHVDRVPDCQILPFADEHEACVHAGAKPQLHTDLLCERGQARPDLGGGPHRTQRVFLMHPRNPEHRHHRVADELRDGSAVALDDRPQLFDISAHHPEQRLRVELLAERGRARHVAEQDRHHLSRPAGRLESDGLLAIRRRLTRSNLGRRRQRLKRGILVEDCALKLLQLTSRLQAKLGRKLGAGAPVDLERVGLPPAPVKGEHLLRPQVLAQRVVGDELLELDDELAL